MVKMKEIELPNRLNVTVLKNILQNMDEVEMLHLKNDLIDIKIVKIEIPVILYLVFGERYIADINDQGRWEYVCYVTDNIDELVFFINSL